MKRGFWIFSVLFFFCTINSQALEVTPPFPTIENKNVGKIVPDFTLKIISGEEKDLESVRAGQKMIMFFWATWCPHCRETLKELELRRGEFEQKDIKLVLVDIGEKRRFVKKFLENNKIHLNTFLDEESSLPEIYGLSGVPAFFLVNRQGIVNMFLYNNLPRDYGMVLDYVYPLPDDSR